MTSSAQKISLTAQQHSQMRTSLNNTLTALLNHITIFFTNPPPRDLPSHLMSPNPATTPVTETPQLDFEDISEWSFLPRYSSALASCKWGLAILETLAKRVQDFIGWGEDTADGVRIAIGGVRERLVKATLLAWKDGISRV
jgi:hypothetical protein